MCPTRTLYPDFEPTSHFSYSYKYQLYSHEKRKEAGPSFNFTLYYTDDVFSLNNSKLGDFVDHIYPTELEIKHTTYVARYASYLDLHLKIDSKDL